MVEVDPMILFAAGSIAAGLAAAAICLRAPSKQVEKNVVSNKKGDQAASAKPKKKAAKTAKKVTSANDSAAESESEIAAIIADIGPIDEKVKQKKTKEVSKSTGPSAAEVAATKAAAKKSAEAAQIAARKAEDAAEAASLEAKLLAEEEEAKKSKKAKETPEQRAARVERQRVAKMKKLEEEELSKSAAIQLAAVESKLVSSVSKSSGASNSSAHVDGWAVVEDKRKVKAKAVVPVAAAKEDAASEPTGPVDSVKTEITVDSKKIGVVKGTKGVTLLGIQDATGVEINTPKVDRESTAPMVITVTGTADGVARATKAINELVTKGYCKLLASDDFKEGSIEVHPNYIKDIIGKGGANIRAIQDFTGVKLAIPQVARDHNLNVKIIVAGTKDKVQIAKDIILELTKYYHTSVTHPGHTHVEMDVPPALYSFIIGARGSEIKHIQANFKVSVHFPSADTVNKEVIVAGEPAGVKSAVKYIQKIIDQALADKDASEKMADSWVDTEAEEGHEQWMDEYTHPSSRQIPSESSSVPMAMGSGVEQEGGFKMGEASTAAGIASASAWGASVLASADGW